MNHTPPATPDPSNPYGATQLRPTWRSGAAPQYGTQPPFGPAEQVPPPAYSVPSYPPPVPPKAPRPRWLLPTMIGGGVVLVVIVLIAAVAIVGGAGGASDSPGATVKAYFAALQAGDAKKALSYGTEAPATTDLVTDEVLRKQIAIAPIKDVTIVSESDAGIGQVHLTVTIGDVAYDEKLMMDKSGDTWKLKTAAVKIDPSAASEADKKNITILGKPLPASGVAYVFPGALDLGSSNKNLQARPSKYSIGGDKGQAPVNGLSAFAIGGSIRVEFGLSDAAKTAAWQQIADKYAACAASKDGMPGDCPQSSFLGVDGSYTWTAPSAEQIDLSDEVRDGSMSFRDTRPWSYTATARDGRPLTGTDTTFTTGTVSVTPDAVAVSVR
ncbi:DUF4878 domain-containing protein [Tsukamurella paurometabola]|uniref:Uncharacterized protein n=1 Tax=Tsukamurella paurometabola (strain ATCC 8368 / DSM 20162 / CCUG 35730 / CIP 100753 / JCM 10117 / KCTC 9821 / NBRC 16120 / NCIMB 702349 / NCTC 13040) TaxID=521096 RepID=D5UTI3_TSUPD|nr:DUF4878 domain-containing protein [Tsukamurella paurometabola]ADG79468.1 conserved hypothetical protein [Tsukamurella paurometabola DSM 20162]SUP35876.1 Lumazine-binding domain [Tsukamurella paurometabola]